jgi:hypothetical protein
MEFNWFWTPYPKGIKMKLYLLYWKEYSWDQYSHAVVVAESAEEARTIHPHSGDNSDNQNEWNKNTNHMWCKSPKDVTNVTYIGEAASDLERGVVVCTSFHAG